MNWFSALVYGRRLVGPPSWLHLGHSFTEVDVGGGSGCLLIRSVQVGGHCLGGVWSFPFSILGRSAVGGFLCISIREWLLPCWGVDTLGACFLIVMVFCLVAGTSWWLWIVVLSWLCFGVEGVR